MEVGKLSASISLATSGFTSGVSTVLSGFSKMGAAAMGMNQTVELMKNVWRGLAGSLGDLSKSFIKAASTTENYAATLKVLLGSRELGSQLAASVQEYAATSAAEYEELMQAAVMMSGVMKGGGQEIMAWLPIIDDVTAAFKSLGLSMPEVAGQITRMYASGAASADLFREKGINAAMGFKQGVEYSAKETREMLVKWHESIKGASLDFANTWTGQMGMIADAWFIWRNEVMNSGGIFEALKEGVRTLLEELDTLKRNGDLARWAHIMAEGVLDALETIGKAILKLIEHFNALRGTIAGIMTKINTDLARGQMQEVSTREKQFNEFLGGVDLKNITPAQQEQLNTLKQNLVNAKEAQKGYIDAAASWSESYNRSAEVQEFVEKGFSGLKKTLQASREAADKALQETLSGEAKPGVPQSNKTVYDWASENKPGDKDKKNKGGAAAKKQANELNRLSEDFAKDFLQAQFDKQKIGMSEYDQGLIKINEDMAEMALKYKDVIDISPGFADNIKELGRQLQENLSAKMTYENLQRLDELMRQANYENATAEMNQYGKAMAGVTQTIAEQQLQLEKLWGVGNVPQEVLDRLNQYGDNLKKATDAQLVGQTMLQGGSTIDQLTLEGRTIGMTDSQAQFEGLRFQLEQMRDAGVEIGDAMERLNQMDLTALGLSLDNQIKKMTNWRGIMDSILGGWSNALAKFFEDFATTGKASLAELAQAMLKELQMLAAKMTAEMLMTALKETVLGLVALASRDPSSGEHFAAAAEAASAAAMFGAFVAGSGLAAMAGMAHDGMSDIPQDGTWLLKKGERVVDDRTNADLKTFLKEGGGGKTPVNMTVNINNSDEQGVMKALPRLKQTIEDVVNSNIRNNGSIRGTILNYTT